MYFLKRSYCNGSHGSKALNKCDLFKLVLKLESQMNSDVKELTLEIRDLLTQMKKVEPDVAIVKKCQ